MRNIIDSHVNDTYKLEHGFCSNIALGKTKLSPVNAAFVIHSDYTSIFFSFFFDEEKKKYDLTFEKSKNTAYGKSWL